MKCRTYLFLIIFTCLIVELSHGQIIGKREIEKENEIISRLNKIRSDLLIQKLSVDIALSKSINAFLEIRDSSPDIQTDDDFIRSLLRKNHCFDYNISFITFTSDTSVDSVIEHIQNSNLFNKDIEDSLFNRIGIQTYKENEKFTSYIIITQNYIDFCDLFEVTALLNYDTQGQFTEYVTICGYSKIKDILYQTYNIDNISLEDLLVEEKLSLRDDNYFEIKLNVSKHLDNKTKSIAFTNLANKVLAFIQF